MSKTIKHKHNSKLFGNGDRGPKHTLMREYHQTNSGLVKDWRNLLDRRDYDSDRNKGWRHIITKLCRTRLKRDFNKGLKDIDNDE